MPHAQLPRLFHFSVHWSVDHLATYCICTVCMLSSAYTFRCPLITECELSYTLTVNRVIQSVLTNYLWLLYMLNHVLNNLTSDLGNGSQIRLNYLIREIYFKIVPEIHFVFNVKCWEISAQALNHIVIA